MRRTGLLLQVTLAMLGVAVVSALVTGLITRTAVSAAFETYVGRLPARAGAGMGPGMGRGRMVLTAAERDFLARADLAVWSAALAAAALGAAVSVVLARRLTQPLQHLTVGAGELAAGRLDHRVDVGGSREVEQLGEAFNEMADSIQRADELRQRMVADVAHELRNPIAAARAQAEGMQEGVLASDPARLESLTEDLRHLSRLVDDLRELSVAESGALDYQMAEFDACAMVRKEVERMPSIKGVSVTMSCPEAPLTAHGDSGRLAQVVRNLLSNAIRHTARGEIAIALASSGDGWSVTVDDSGEGIPESDLPFVFERFYRSDTARASDTGGAGIGLTISKRIVEDHGGSIRAENRPGGGTRMTFEIPWTTDRR